VGPNLSAMSPDSAAASSAVENYLKVIYSLGERDSAPVTTSRLAKRLGVAPSSVSGMLRRLVELGLAEHRRYGQVTLTAAGTAAALQVLRRHRLLEMYLVAELGYTWDEVHDDAEVLEHGVSERLLARMDAKLEHPTVDPHGDPIPSAEGRIAAVAAARLSTLAPGARGPLVRVDDTDPAVLRHLSEHGIALGQSVELLARRPFDGPFVARVGDHEHDLAPQLAAALWIGGAVDRLG